MISKKTIGEIFDRLSVLDVVQDFVNMKKRGVNFIGLCPFHNEKTPSFTVSPSKNIYKCFGCGRGGNGIDFLMEHEAYSYPEALRYVANLYNIPIEETYQSSEEIQESHRRDSLQIVNDFALEFFREQFWNSDQGKSVALGYMKERGFIEKTIKSYELGFAIPSRDELTREAGKKGYKKEYLQELGLVTQRNQDFFFDRIIFPIHSMSGKPIAFAGRLLRSRTNAPKYLNSPESEIYQKRKVLFGLHLAKKTMRSENKCYLVEGYTDVMMMHQNGFQNVVATSGTALTPDQIRMIKRYTDTIVLVFDSDTAGAKATLKGIDLILEESMNVLVLPLPEGTDPDSFVLEQGHGGFTEYESIHRMDFLKYKLSLISEEDKQNPVTQSEMIRDIIDSIAIIDDGIKRHLYLRETAKWMNVPEQTLVDVLNESLENRIKQMKTQRLRDARQARREQPPLFSPPTESIQKAPEVSAADSLHEKDIIRVLIQHGQKHIEENLTVSEFVMENISDVVDFFQNPGYKKILDHYLQSHQNNTPIDFEYFNRSEDQELRKTAIDVHTDKYDGDYSKNWIDMWDMDLQTQLAPDKNHIKDVRQALMRFKLKKAMDLCASNRKKIEQYQAEGKDQEALKHLVAHQKLLSIRDQIAKEFKTIIVKGSSHRTV